MITLLPGEGGSRQGPERVLSVQLHFTIGLSLNYDYNSLDNSIYAYLNGKKDGQNVDWICDIKGKVFYTIENPLDGYMIMIKLSSGQTFHNISITPVVSKVCQLINNDTENIRIWHVQTGILDSLFNKDKKLLYRDIKSQQNKYAWQSIAYEDGSGIQFTPATVNDGIQGTQSTMDVFGRVCEVE